VSPGHRAGLLALALALALALGAAASGQAPQAGQPTFQSGVQLVEVDVRVFDREGGFVTGLTRDDFEILENGEPQAVDALHFVHAMPPASSPAGPTAAPVPASTPPVAPQTWIFLFDLAHLTAGGGFERARTAVDAFIRNRFREGDLAGVVAGDQMLNNRLTSVRQELVAAVAEVKPRADARTRTLELTRQWPRLLDEEEAIRIARGEVDVIRRAVARACADDPEYCRQGDPEPEVRAKGQRMQQDIRRASAQTLATLHGLAARLARMTGPKTLVFLSDGFVSQDIETTLRAVVGQLTRAGARLYAIDVRGLSRIANPGLLDQAQVDDPAGAVTRFDGVADGPNSLALDTGGLLIRNENNIGRALDRIADDASRYYVLVYQPSNPALDGSYRPLQVRVKREGLRVRARRGYLALPASRMLVPRPITSTTDATLASPDLARATPADPADEEPAPPAPRPVENTTRGVVVAAPAAAPDTARATGVRLRPDTEGRIRDLSARDTAAASTLAAAGWEAYQRGDVERALTAFAGAVAQPDARPWVWYALGMSQAALGQAASAITSWRRVLQAAPDFQPVYMDLADAYAALSDLTSALAIVRQAEARWPGSADVHSAIGVIHVRRGALNEGIAALVRTTELNPGDDLAFLNLGRAYALRYQRGRRFVSSQRRWVAPDDDRQRAIAALERCVKLGGPYATPAKEELTFLEWSKQR
jgi:VWFA-related protein